jgi:hypothetical protein
MAFNGAQPHVSADRLLLFLANGFLTIISIVAAIANVLPNDRCS